MNINSFIFTAGGASVFIDGLPYTVAQDHINYKKIISACAQSRWDDVAELMNIKAAVAQYVRKSDDISIVDDVVLFRGEQVPALIGQRIRQLFEANLPIEPLQMFLHNLYENPSNTAINETYEFLEFGNLPITSDGHFLAYKKVRYDYTSVYDGVTDNSIGTVLSMPRRDVDDNRNRTCSHGLHFCSYDYIKHFSGERIVVLKVNPKDVVSIPADYHNTKGRACSYEVVGEVDMQHTTSTNKCRWTNAPLIDYVDRTEIVPERASESGLLGFEDASVECIDWFSEGYMTRLMHCNSTLLSTKLSNILVRGISLIRTLSPDLVDEIIACDGDDEFVENTLFADSGQFSGEQAYALGFAFSSLAELINSGLYDIENVEDVFALFADGDREERFAALAFMAIADRESEISAMFNHNEIVDNIKVNVTKDRDDWIAVLQNVVEMFYAEQSNGAVGPTRLIDPIHKMVNFMSSRLRIRQSIATNPGMIGQASSTLMRFSTGDAENKKMQVLSNAVQLIVEWVSSTSYNVDTTGIYSTRAVTGRALHITSSVADEWQQPEHGLYRLIPVTECIETNLINIDPADEDHSLLLLCVKLVIILSDMKLDVTAEQLIRDYYDPQSHASSTGTMTVDEQDLDDIQVENTFMSIGANIAFQAPTVQQFDISNHDYLLDGLELLMLNFVQIVASTEFHRDMLTKCDWTTDDAQSLCLYMACGFLYQLTSKSQMVGPIFLDEDARTDIFNFLVNLRNNHDAQELLTYACSEQMIQRIVNLSAMANYCVHDAYHTTCSTVSQEVRGAIPLSVLEADLYGLDEISKTFKHASENSRATLSMMSDRGVATTILMSVANRTDHYVDVDTDDIVKSVDVIMNKMRAAFCSLVKLRDALYTEYSREGRRGGKFPVHGPMLQLKQLAYTKGKAHARRVRF